MEDQAVSRRFLMLGSALAAAGVAAGAFGAHGLKNAVSQEMLAIFDTAVRYQVYHSMGLIVCGVVSLILPNASRSWLKAAGWFFGLGILGFSGSLYLLSLSGVRWLGAITPLGGVSFIAGWIALMVAVWRAK